MNPRAAEYLALKQLKRPEFSLEDFIARRILNAAGVKSTVSRKTLYFKLTGSEVKGNLNLWTLGSTFLTKLLMDSTGEKVTLMPEKSKTIPALLKTMKDDPYVLKSSGRFGVFLYLVRLPENAAPQAVFILPQEKVFDVVTPRFVVHQIPGTQTFVGVSQPLDELVKALVKSGVDL